LLFPQFALSLQDVGFGLALCFGLHNFKLFAEVKDLDNVVQPPLRGLLVSRCERLIPIVLTEVFVFVFLFADESGLDNNCEKVEKYIRQELTPLFGICVLVKANVVNDCPLILIEI